ncbi:MULTISPECIES: hypothetical protein [Cupriavidus]|uniref:hypothetical protein n=1 Tax=Cupriavidus TaxID=106589 RepID=UPI000045FADB|nr:MULTISPECIES: hypothetical protein [Cupriavidus]QYY29564.1 hypothetical protein K2O51_05110 [Cupriavidus pinatubonensis]TPQ42973.1 hypothetical protein C2U69_04240 [Cupriavidus pinatubonensis]
MDGTNVKHRLLMMKSLRIAAQSVVSLTRSSSIAASTNRHLAMLRVRQRPRGLDNTSGERLSMAGSGQAVLLD